MDSTFIYKQGSLNREHFIIALKVIGARKPACHLEGWPWLGSSQVYEVLGEGRIITYCSEPEKDAQEILCSHGGKLRSGDIRVLGI